MQTTTVTSKGQVTIPRHIRQQLGIHRGSKIAFTIVGNHVEMHVSNTVDPVEPTGFAILKSKRAAVPADFDAADLLAPARLP